ncbi:MAG: signal recognition particle-docking protein FtsY [Lachnospiraceae bacterium]|nr:signal recognition particle-docking protein FtsY [Lachnospiraceae bacterium]
MAGFFNRLKEGLSKTRDNIVGGIESVFSGHDKIDDDFYEELEEILIMGDVGVHATGEIIDKLKEDVRTNHIRDPKECRAFLIDGIKEQMKVTEEDYEFLSKPSVVMVIGVNGVGKTTTIGKLASIYKAQGKKILIAAADTFRAAATEQLEEWAKRAGVDIISAKEGADPGSVLFDATNAARSRKADVLLCDTAGRLHNKKNLMNELEKLSRIVDRNLPDYKRENLIVLDGTTGQNALVQAKEFSEVADLSGIVLTKMDGTAKGGIAIAIQSELNIPVKYIGVGEKITDLQEFDPDAFVKALFDTEDGDDGSNDDVDKSDENMQNDSYFNWPD